MHTQTVSVILLNCGSTNIHEPPTYSWYLTKLFIWADCTCTCRNDIFTPSSFVALLNKPPDAFVLPIFTKCSTINGILLHVIWPLRRHHHYFHFHLYIHSSEYTSLFQRRVEVAKHSLFHSLVPLFEFIQLCHHSNQNWNSIIALSSKWRRMIELRSLRLNPKNEKCKNVLFLTSISWKVRIL